MNEQELDAIRELFASGIACAIDIGRAIKNGRIEDRQAAIGHAETFAEQIRVLSAPRES